MNNSINLAGVIIVALELWPITVLLFVGLCYAVRRVFRSF